MRRFGSGRSRHIGGQPSLETRAQVLDRERPFAGDGKDFPAGRAKPHHRHRGSARPLHHGVGILRGDDIAALVLAEPEGVTGGRPAAPRARRRCRRPSPFRRAPPEGRRRRRRAPRSASRRGSGRARIRRAGARRQGRPAAEPPPRGRRSRADRATGRASLRFRRSSRIASPSRLEGERRRLGEIVEKADAADRRGRQDRAAVGLVVERDIAGNDREIERAAGFADAADAADQLAHDLGPLRIAEIEIVGHARAGSAPTAVRLRQASATACLPPSNGSASQ